MNLSQIGRSNDYKLIFSEVFGIGVVQVSSKGFGAELETVQLSGNTDRRRLDYRLPWYEFVRIGVRDYERFGGVEVLTMAVRQVDEKTARKFSEGYRLNGTFVVNIR